jgi:hypothetical protein
MGNKKKKLRFKKPRRKLTSESLFPKKEMKAVVIKDYFLRIAFPDYAKRQAYITALIKGLEEEPIIPDTQFTR